MTSFLNSLKKKFLIPENTCPPREFSYKLLPQIQNPSRTLTKGQGYYRP